MLKTDGLPELSKIDVFKSPCFVFDIHSREKKDLITRYRGTVCRKLPAGFEIVSWQKSMYRFGGLYREVPITLHVMLDESARIVSLTIDEESCGSQGKSCDFACLERSLRDKLINRPFTQFSQIYKDAGTIDCLHVFEILSGASAFFSFLAENGRSGGAEQEMVKISPDSEGLTAENVHEVLGKTAVTQISLRHNAAPTLGKKGLPESMDAHLSVSVNGKTVSETDIKADDFPGCYSRLNRAYTRAYHAEKKFFAAGGKQRFSNLPSLVGLTVLALSHEGMSGTFSRAAKLENILIFLQTGEGREGCIGFRNGLNMNQQYILKAAIGAALGCAALALGIALKRRVRL